MIYKFKMGSYRGLDAQQAGDELERIRQFNGGHLATQAVWREAKKKSSPLHNAFTWDVDKAAEERWADQARALIRAVVQVEGEVERSAFINVSIHNEATETEEATVERYYQAVHVLPSNPAEFESALAAARVRAISAQNAIDELLSIVPRGKKASIKRAHQHAKRATQELAA